MLGDLKILMVGCGAMGSAMIKGWATAGVGDRQYTIVTPHESSVMALRAFCDIQWCAEPSDLAQDYQPDVIILAVKPQIMLGVLEHYRPYAAKGALIITVAAGKQLDFYTPVLGESTKLVRVMPNLPVAYNKGMTLGIASQTLNDTDLRTTHELFTALGKLLWLKQEAMFDVATTISGCGPAYVYLLTDALAEAGMLQGLNREDAELLARQTVIGAGEHLAHSEDSAVILKKKVTSPGGVTEAALKVLEQPERGLPTLMADAIVAAVKRAKEIAHG